MPAASPFIAHSLATLLPILYQVRLERHPASQRGITALEEHILERKTPSLAFAYSKHPCLKVQTVSRQQPR